MLLKAFVFPLISCNFETIADISIGKPRAWLHLVRYSALCVQSSACMLRAESAGVCVKIKWATLHVSSGVAVACTWRHGLWHSSYFQAQRKVGRALSKLMSSMRTLHEICVTCTLLMRVYIMLSGLIRLIIYKLTGQAWTQSLSYHGRAFFVGSMRVAAFLSEMYKKVLFCTCFFFDEADFCCLYCRDFFSWALHSFSSLKSDVQIICFLKFSSDMWYIKMREMKTVWRVLCSSTTACNVVFFWRACTCTYLGLTYITKTAASIMKRVAILRVQYRAVSVIWYTYTLGIG